MITKSGITAAAARIAPYIRVTPVLQLRSGNLGLPHGVTLKLEHLQHSGSFKARGAFNTLLGAKLPAAGVAAASGGNHGAAVAHAARELGVKARIFVPTTSSPAKIARIKASGAELVLEGERYAEALAACERYAAESGALSIHAYDADLTLAGQGTIGLEWQNQAPDLDTILVAVGGGGLIGGIASAYAGRAKIVGVEPEGACCLHAALQAGARVTVSVNSLAADSLGASICGERVFEIAKSHIDSVVLVTDAAIAAAQSTLWRELRQVTEPGGACALAALLSGAYKPMPSERVGVLLCGGNTGLDVFPA